MIPAGTASEGEEPTGSVGGSEALRKEPAEGRTGSFAEISVVVQKNSATCVMLNFPPRILPAFLSPRVASGRQTNGDCLGPSQKSSAGEELGGGGVRFLEVRV